MLTWRRALIEGWDERPSSSSSSEEDLARAAASYGPVYGEEDLARAAAASYGPVYGEEEDLARAIQLSLAESSLSAAPKGGCVLFIILYYTVVIIHSAME